MPGRFKPPQRLRLPLSRHKPAHGRMVRQSTPKIRVL
ncbi:hypothetical protein P448_02385, partial [Mycobacterium tuberculosis TKK_02_0033]